MANAVHRHLDANGKLGVVGGEGRDIVGRKHVGRAARAVLVTADFGDDFVMRHGDHVDRDRQRAKVATLAVRIRIARGRVGPEGRQKSEKGQHASGVQEGEGHAHDEHASHGHRPVDQGRIDGTLVSRAVVRVRRLGLADAKVVCERTRTSLLVGRALVHLILLIRNEPSTPPVLSWALLSSYRMLVISNAL